MPSLGPVCQAPLLTEGHLGLDGRLSCQKLRNDRHDMGLLPRPGGYDGPQEVMTSV